MFINKQIKKISPITWNISWPGLKSVGQGEKYHSFIRSLSRVPYKKLPSLVLYVFTLPSFSSILCPLLSPSIHVKQYLFSIIHLSFLILFCVFPMLIYLFFSSSTTLQSILFILIGWSVSGFSWDDPELLDCGALQQLSTCFPLSSLDVW